MKLVLRSVRESLSCRENLNLDSNTIFNKADDVTKVPPVHAEFALRLLTGVRAPGAEEGRCSPENSFSHNLYFY